MTETPANLVPAALSFNTPDRDVMPTPFDLDGEILTAIKPKGGQLLHLVREVRKATNAGDEMAQAEVVDQFMALAMEPESARRLTERLDDPDDPFDLDTLTVIIQSLQEVWAIRPTGQSSGSSRRRKPTGRASTGRARSSG